MGLEGLPVYIAEWSLVDAYPGSPTHAGEKDCRPCTNASTTAATLLNGIVFKQVTEDEAEGTSRDSQGSGGPIPPGWWFSASVAGQRLAIRANSVRGRIAQCEDRRLAKRGEVLAVMWAGNSLQPRSGQALSAASDSGFDRTRSAANQPDLESALRRSSKYPPMKAKIHTTTPAAIPGQK